MTSIAAIIETVVTVADRSANAKSIYMNGNEFERQIDKSLSQSQMR